MVPLLSFAKISYDLEQPIVWRSDRLPTLTVRATIRDATQPPTIVAALQPKIDAYIRALPEGYTLATGGAVEESAKGQGPIAAVVPALLWFDKPTGFVAILGILALIGINIRNALILVSQIEESEAGGLHPGMR